MKSFIDRFSNLVKGTISGFDRIVFKGLVLSLMSTSQETFARLPRFSGASSASASISLLNFIIFLIKKYYILLN